MQTGQTTGRCLAGPVAHAVGPRTSEGTLVKGTRLYSATRSPLIHGRSRRERPFSSDWIAGAGLGFLACVVAAGLFFGDKGASAMTLVAQIAFPALLGAVLGGALGVWIAQAFGWHPRWISGAVGAGVLGLLVVVGSVVSGIQLFGV